MNSFNKNEKEYIKFISDKINTLNNSIRKPKYSTEYYMTNIYYVLKTGIQWNKLICPSHYTSIYKKFIIWNKNNIFKEINNNLLNNYINNTNIKNTYIDSSHIKNINGSDLIGRNHYDRFRNSTVSNVAMRHY